MYIVYMYMYMRVPVMYYNGDICMYPDYMYTT